jgi:fluoroacetyl-CoA thioesterase
MSAEKTVTVSFELAAGHFVADMLHVYASPMMILHMEMASGAAAPLPRTSLRAL